MTVPNVYPKQMRTVLAYIDALDQAEILICDAGDKYDTDVVLEIRVKVDETVIGSLVDEVGGAWSFQPSEFD